MNFVNRAFKNVTRRLPKTILLALTFFLIGNLVIIGLGISNASSQAKILTRQKMRAVATVSVDYSKVEEYIYNLEDEDEINNFYNNYPSVTLNDVKSLLADNRVKTANATSIQQYYLTNDSTIDYVHLNNSAEENIDNQNLEGLSEDELSYIYVPAQFSVKANYFPSMIELEEGEFSIVKGEFYDQEDIDNGNPVVVITEELAEYNSLDVGDTIRLSFANSNDYEVKNAGLSEEDLIVEYEIIGIYSHTNHITRDSENYDYTEPYENPDNMMLCPGTTFNVATIDAQQKIWNYYQETYPDNDYYNDPDNYPSLDNFKKVQLYDVTLLLNDPLDVDQFVEDYKDSVGQFISVDADNDEFKRLSKPLDTLSLYAKFIVTLVIVNAVVIISLVTALTLKTREYEIGVLLSIGASKFKIVAQFFIELALVAIIGFTLAVGSGSLIANKVGATVLDYQIQTSELDQEDDDNYFQYTSIWDNDYSTDVSLDDLISEYNVSVSPLIIAEIYVVGLGIVFISIIIPSMMIMRFNPKKILMNQN